MLQRLLLLAITMMCLLALSELAMRGFTDQAQSLPFFRGDSLYGRGYYPNRTVRYRSTANEYSTIIETNSLGFRDTEHAIEKPEGTRRVLVLGDSFAAGREVDFADTFSQVLQRDLSTTNNIEFINLSVEHYSPANEYLVMKNIGVSYRPDIVLLTFCFNDVSEDINQKSLITHDEQGLPIRIAPPDYLPVSHPENDDGSILPSPKEFLRRHSHFYWFLENRMHVYVTKRRVAERAADVYKDARSGDITKDYFAVFNDSLTSTDREAWAEAFQHIHAIHALCDAVAARMLIVVVPTGNQINADEWGGGKAFWKFPAGEILESTALQDRLEEFARGDDIATLDLLPFFRASSRPGERMYFDYDGHWTEHGHAVAARAIEETFEREHWLESAIGDDRAPDAR